MDNTPFFFLPVFFGKFQQESYASVGDIMGLGSWESF
jgi:hypothetical protein